MIWDKMAAPAVKVLVTIVRCLARCRVVEQL